MALAVKALGSAPILGQTLEGVALLGVEHFVFQIVGNARRGIQPLAVQRKAGIHAAVPGGEEGVFPGVLRLWHHADLKGRLGSFSR